jgi:hypothetical protein
MPARETASAPERSLKRAGFAALNNHQRRDVARQLKETYGFDLETIAEHQRLEILQRADAIYAVPDRLLAHFADFPCVAIGMLIGEWHETIFILRTN